MFYAFESKGSFAVRVTSVFNTLLQLPGVWVTTVAFHGDRVEVGVRLRRRKLVCPHCGWATHARFDTRPADSWWRGLDLGVWKVHIRARLRRLHCRACDRVSTEQVPFARHGARFTRDVEDLVAWLAQRTDKTTITRLCRINWRTVGAIIERIVGEQLDDARLEGLYHIGIDEVTYRKHHHYLTVVTDHASGKVVWTGPGRNAAAAAAFFHELGPERASQLTAISMDMGAAYLKAARTYAPQAKICIDPYHVVALANGALDRVRRDHWNHLRATAPPTVALTFKGARWALLRRPEDLKDSQQHQLAAIRRTGNAVWRAYACKEALRALYDHDLDPTDAPELLDRWIGWAQRTRLPAYITLGRTIRKHHEGILNAIQLGLSNGRAEGRNNVVRLITRRGYGFHSAEAVAALVMLTCGPITTRLPHHN